MIFPCRRLARPLVERPDAEDEKKRIQRILCVLRVRLSVFDGDALRDNARAMKTLADWLAHCERLHPKTIELGLERVRAVAGRMGLTLACPVITVAGTNGKGSTCALLEAILQQAGFRTGV